MALKSMLTVYAALLTSFTVAAPASADQYDYVSALDNNGIYYSSISDVIDLGKQLCSVGRSAPTNGVTIGPMWLGLLKNAGYFSDAEASIIITAATHYMCPDIKPRLNADVAAVENRAVPPPVIG